MKQFWLFTGSNYYPQGGMQDFNSSYNTLEEAIASYKKQKEEKDSYEFAWAHVYNSKDNTIDFDTEELNNKEDYKFLST